MTRRPRRFFIETWGCQMNELDSHRLAGQLMEQGVLPVREPEEADLILLNSCSVREKAAQKLYSRVGELKRLKRARPHLLVGLCGCVAQQEGAQALERAPALDFVIGPARIPDLHEVIARRLTGERPVAIGFPPTGTYAFESIVRDGVSKGMITVVEGCNKSCTFCIVPATRGPERCRPLAEILAEVRHLIAMGFLEIELLGQTINHWREPGGDLDFANLLDAVASEPGVRRLRFVTSYPRDFTGRMVEQLGRHSNICPALHLPVQSGSDRVLRRMGRGYTKLEYLELVASLREARPDIALSTDIIVGFPGETDTDLEATIELLEQVRFATVFAFCYSPRPGTAAVRLGDEVPAQVARERLQRVLATQDLIQRQENEQLVGRTLEVLVTGADPLGSRLTGRTPCHRVVHFEATPDPPRPGAALLVRIDRALPHSLQGSPIAPSLPAA